MQITAEQITRISKGKPPVANVTSLVDGLNTYGASVGVDQPHRLAQFLAQIMHESGGLRYNKEIWGPTAAQKRYEGRKDLGNTHKGDGSKYRGYGILQITGRSNVTAFKRWCDAKGMNAPDFVAKPELIATAPWSCVAALWYWDTRDLNKYADRGDIENITRRVNGGLNGYQDRLDYYDRASLVLLGYPVNALQKFQSDEGLDADGILGPLTRAALQKELLKLRDKSDQSKTQKAPVVQKVTKTVIEEKKVPVKLGEPNKPFWQSRSFLATTGTGGLVTTAVANVGTIPWQNLVILVGAAFLGLLAYLVYNRFQDAKKQDEKAEAIKS